MKSHYLLFTAILFSLNFNSQNLISTVREIPYESSWFTTNLDEYSYDSENYLVEHVKSVSPIFESYWTLESRKQYTYDEDENVTSILWQNWDVSGGIWENDHQSFYDYNSNGDVTFKLSYSYDNIEVEDSSLTNYTYDSDNRLIIRTSFVISEVTEDWYPYSQSDYLYSANGDTTYQVNQLNYFGELVNFSKKITNVNTANLLETSITQSWFEDEWINQSRKNYLYDENDVLISYLREYWEESQNEFAQSSMDNYTYNTDGTEHQIHGYFWYNDEDGWELDERDTHIYEIIDGINSEDYENENIVLYPNPFVDALEIVGLPSGKFNMSIWDLSGKVLMSETMVASDYHSSYLDNLKSGFYILQVTQNDYFISKKIKKE